jgi:hypothetical protein
MGRPFSSLGAPGALLVHGRAGGSMGSRCVDPGSSAGIARGSGSTLPGDRRSRPGGCHGCGSIRARSRARGSPGLEVDDRAPVDRGLEDRSPRCSRIERSRSSATIAPARIARVESRARRVARSVMTRGAAFFLVQLLQAQRLGGLWKTCQIGASYPQAVENLWIMRLGARAVIVSHHFCYR